MLARRVIAISPDKEIAKRLGLGLRAAGGAVETYDSLDALAKGDIQAALVVVHLEGPLAGAIPKVIERLQKDARLIVVLSKSNLVDTVATMQTGDKIAGMLVADDLKIEAVSSMAYRILYGDIFGVEKVVPWGTRIYSMLVGDYQEKSVCISQISEFASLMGVRRKYRESIEQVLDEMLMNALYDAPVDAEGKQLFADVPTKTRISLRMEQKAVVQYACDGETFTVSVRDSFGTLQRDTVLRYLHKCLHSEQQIDRKTGGAGLGLYIMANTTTLFYFNLLPGVATEAICTFDLTAPKVQLKHFGFFTEKIDPAGRLVGGASKLLPTGAGFPVERRDPPAPTARAVTLGLGAAILLLLALIGLVAYPRFAKEPTGSLMIATTPPGATIEVDGNPRGGTAGGPLTIDGLTMGRQYRITATRDGWQSATKFLEPGTGTPTPIDFELTPEAVLARIDSEPQGADVYFQGNRIGTTPFSFDGLPAGTEVELTFKRTAYRDGTRAVRLPGPGGEIAISHALLIDPRWGSVSLTSTPPGATIFHNGNLQVDRTPVDELLVPTGQEQTFTVKLPGHMPGRATITLKPGQQQVPLAMELKKGGGLTVTAADLPQGQVTVRGVRECTRRPLPMRDCPLANGTYKIEVSSGRPYARLQDEVTIAGNDVEHAIKVGIVSTAATHKLVIRGFKTDKAALLEGTHKLDVLDEATGETAAVEVRVQEGRTITIP